MSPGLKLRIQDADRARQRLKGVIYDQCHPTTIVDYCETYAKAVAAVEVERYRLTLQPWMDAVLDKGES